MDAISCKLRRADYKAVLKWPNDSMSLEHADLPIKMNRRGSGDGRLSEDIKLMMDRKTVPHILFHIFLPSAQSYLHLVSQCLLSFA